MRIFFCAAYGHFYQKILILSCLNGMLVCTAYGATGLEKEWMDGVGDKKSGSSNLLSDDTQSLQEATQLKKKKDEEETKSALAKKKIQEPLLAFNPHQERQSLHSASVVTDGFSTPFDLNASTGYPHTVVDEVYENLKSWLK